MAGGVVGHKQQLPTGAAPLHLEGHNPFPVHVGLHNAPARPGALVAQPRQGLAQPDELAVVVGQAAEAPGPVPVQPVDLGGGFVAVVVPQLGAAKLLPRLEEQVPLAGEAHKGGQPVLGQQVVPGLLVAHRPARTGGTQRQLIPKGIVIVGGHIVDHLGAGPGLEVAHAPRPAGGGAQDGLPQPHSAVDKAGLLTVEAVALDGVPGGIAEHADAGIQQGGAVLHGGNASRLHRGIRRPPGLAVYQLFPLAEGGVQRPLDAVHQLHGQKAHQVEAEAVDMVFLRPVQHRVDNIVVRHGPPRRDVVAAAGTVGQRPVRPSAVVIPGRGPLQPGVGGIGVVIHHVHHHPQAVFMERLHHLLALPDAHRPIGRIGGIAALGHVVVHGVVAPVKLAAVPLLVHRAKIVNGQKLDMGDPQPLQMLHAQGEAALPVPPGEGLEPAAVLLRHAAVRVVGEVLHVELIDDVLRREGGRRVPAEALRVGARQIHRHAPLPVAAAGGGVRVGGEGGIPLHRHLEVIVDAVEIPLHRAAPHPPVPQPQQPVVKPGPGSVVPV